MTPQLHAGWRYLLARVLGELGTGRRRARNEQPHVAFLVWGFAPAVWGGVYRPLSLCRYADFRRLDLNVITGPMRCWC